MRKSIFAKYFTIVAAIISVSVIVFSGIVISSSQKQWIENKNALLSRNVRTVSEILSDPTNRYEYGRAQVYQTIDVISSIIDSTMFIVDENGQCYYATGKSKSAPENGAFVDSSVISKATKGKYVETGTLGGALKERCFVVGYPIMVNNVQNGVVFASVPMRQSNSYIFDVFKIILYAGIIVILLAFMATYLVSAQLTKPLRQMVQVIKKIESGDFSARLPVDRKDEIGLLADSINKMAVSVGQLEGMRRDFISSVSHELKTPMTTISGFVDGILDGTIPKEETSKYLQIVSDETKRLSRLVNSMLQLSRLQSETIKLNKTTFNLSDMIISIFLSFEQKIENKHLEISGLDLLRPVSITADRDLIYQVVYNLTENAIKFTPEGGTVSVTSGVEKQLVKFSIKNTGEGLRQSEMAKIFERFYKTDRSRSNDKTGMGFGLYIVKTIVGLHNGKITVGSVLGEYTQFDVTLPDTEIVAEIDDGNFEKGADK
ncbi:MAG: ATP-binding protein [Acutalibacteraceae bacterium]|nr:ATP-binding protein [Acutalibacteraceae bacterium]